MKLVATVTPHKYEGDAKKVLEEAIAKNFETVIVFGFTNKQMQIVKSADKGTLELIGALEAAKQHVWKGGE